MADFYNIDGTIGVVTPWYSPLNQALYSGSNLDTIEQTYTRIIEVPEAINTGTGVAYTYAQYWGLPSIMKTKFATSRKFMLTYTPLQSTVHIYLNGSEVSLYTYDGDTRYINIPSEPTDGYLRIEYMASSMDYAAGDTREALASVGLLGKQQMMTVGEENILRARRAINRMEYVTSLRPSTWVGGPRNTIISGPKNLIKTVSPIHYEHIVGLRTALDRVRVALSTLLAVPISEFSFTTIAEGKPYMVQYTEEILSTVNVLEALIIANTGNANLKLW